MGGIIMNSRLVKIAIEMQLEEKNQKKSDNISVNKRGGKRLFDFFKPSFVTVPIRKD